MLPTILLSQLGSILLFSILLLQPSLLYMQCPCTKQYIIIHTDRRRLFVGGPMWGAIQIVLGAWVFCLLFSLVFYFKNSFVVAITGSNFPINLGSTGSLEISVFATGSANILGWGFKSQYWRNAETFHQSSYYCIILTPSKSLLLLPPVFLYFLEVNLGVNTCFVNCRFLVTYLNCMLECLCNIYNVAGFGHISPWLN